MRENQYGNRLPLCSGFESFPVGDINFEAAYRPLNVNDMKDFIKCVENYPKAIEHLKFVYSLLKISNEKYKEGFLEIEDFLKGIEQ